MFFSAVGDAIQLTLLAGKPLMIAAFGCANLSTTVSGSGAVMGSVLASTHCGAHVHGDFESRWKFAATAAESNGVPSLNLIPGRSLIVRVLALSLNV